MLTALNAYKRGIPVPNLKRLDKIVMGFTGQKSLHSFGQNVCCLFVKLEGENVRIIPSA